MVWLRMTVLTVATGIAAVSSLATQWGNMSTEGMSGSAAPCALERAPRVRIGVDDGDPRYTFQRITDSAILGSGRIVLVDRDAKNIRMFNAEGVHERTLGRKGSGPGEFSDPIYLDILGRDTIVVFDWDHQRLTVYDGEGNLKRTIPIRPGITNPSGFFGVFSSGAPFVLGVTEAPAMKPKEFIQKTLRLQRHGADGALADRNLLTVRDGTQGWAKESIRMVTSPDFEPRVHVATGRNYLFVSEGASPLIKVFNSRMQLVRTVTWPDENRAVTKPEVEKYRSDRLKDLKGEWLKTMTEYTRVTPVSPVFPAVGHLLADRQDNVWAKAYTRPLASHHRWQKFNSAGRHVCALAMPREMTALEFGADYVVVATRNEDDVPSVQVYGIVAR